MLARRICLALVGLLFWVIGQGGAAEAGQLREKDLALERLIGQMIIVGFDGTGQDPQSESFTLLLEDVRQGRIGGVILFDKDYRNGTDGRNIISIEQVGALSALLQEQASTPLFISIDQEGGAVQRLRAKHGAPSTPAALVLGLTEPTHTYRKAQELGAALHRAGINLNFAPAVDVNINPLCPAIGIHGRSYSRDPQVVVDHAKAFIRGMEESGVGACIKHFPGHGSSKEDSHEGVTDVTQSWHPDELVPYSHLLGEQDPVGMVMVGHLMHTGYDPELPASLSAAMINGLLRDQLGFQGVVVTDDLEMHAILNRYSQKEIVFHAVNAGVDILLFGNNKEYSASLVDDLHKAFKELLKEGKISYAQLRTSHERILALKERISAVPQANK